MPDQPSEHRTSSDLPETVDVPSNMTPEGRDPGQVRTDDLRSTDSTTSFVPSFPAPVGGAAPLPPPKQKSRHSLPDLPATGQVIGDFEMLQILGAGAFATVFLARQISLDRQVALKISANRGSEARTLAGLEHEHIVRVFSEAVDSERNQLLVCMQFVAGTTLEQVIRKLVASPANWSGRAILEAIDALSKHPATFDPAALRDREQLMRCDFMEAVCWIGTRVAEALAHAHNQGVLHRDIKPANILMNRYGRPLLADFNVSLDPKRMTGPAGEVFGGTLGYMAPEHLDAFNPTEATTAAAVDERSDIYSLGLVFYEMLTGKLPFATVPRTTKAGDSLRIMASQRRIEAPSPRVVRPDVPEVLDRVVRRCLAPDPAKRYQNAAALAEALKGCLDHRRMEKDLPRGGLLTRLTLRHPLWVGLSLAFLPHVLGSIVNISYNTLRIVNTRLEPDQREAFQHFALVYNLLLYPVSIWLIVRLMTPVIRVWRQLSGPDIPDDEEVGRVRRRALRLPAWALVLAILGWLPGGVLFPLGISWLSRGVDADVYFHFMVSFTISGLIALTYSLFAVQFLVLRVMYPRLWVDARGLRHESREEVGPLDWRLAVFQFLSGLIPLAGAVMMLFASGNDFPFSYRLLVIALILLGGLGFTAALSASKQLQRIQVALSGGDRRGTSEGRTFDTTTFISIRSSERSSLSDRQSF